MITIQKISDVYDGQELKFTLGENSAIFGTKLKVHLPVTASKRLYNESKATVIRDLICLYFHLLPYLIYCFKR